MALTLSRQANGTFQGRIVQEFILNNISANDYLINIFIPKFNKRFANNYKTLETSPSQDKINYLLARKIDKGSSINYMTMNII